MLQGLSAFDEAMDRPLLDEPVKKRWLWLSNSSATSMTDGNGLLNVDYREYKAPIVTQEIDFESDHDNNLTMSEQGRMINVDWALLEERHEHIGEINMSMKHIHEIQKDLALVVESQNDNVQKLEHFAIDTLDHATSGISHLLKLQQQFANESQRRKQVVAGLALLIIIIGAHWVIFNMVQDDDGPDQN